jgi:predicted RNase H-like nuclease (RuvC/YqgF family)
MYSLKEAAEACGRGKPAILKAIQKGRISANKNQLGEWEIDPSELHRVYKPIVPRSTHHGSTVERWETPVEPLETEVLRRENAFLREQTELLKDERHDLRRRLDEEAAERRKSADEIRRLTLLLTHQPEPKPEATPAAQPTPETTTDKGRLWQKLFGRVKL